MSKVWKIGITGSREGMTPQQQAAFIEMLADHPKPFRWLLHGCCVGVDEQAHWLAFELGISSIGYPPTDTRLMMEIDSQYPELQFQDLRMPKPYLDRNRDIVQDCDELWVFPKTLDTHIAGGTGYTYRYAKTARRLIDVHIFWPNGDIDV